jgi:hypothetical protein
MADRCGADARGGRVEQIAYRQRFAVVADL